MRAIDFHVHLPTPDWLDGSIVGYVEVAEAYFRSKVPRQSLGELADKYRALDAKAVLLAWDAETATGRPRVPNETVAAACRDYPDAFTGIGSVDPHKGEAAIAEVANIAALGLRGVKFHPSLQAFAPDDPAFWPVFAACEEHDLLALFHTGTSGIGARQPGGQGIRIDYAHPLKLDAVAAAHPGLTVVAAHFGWPWHMDLIAVALHKTNVYIDISGWSPKRIPPEVVRELQGRLSGQFVWGSDFPFISPERCLAELDELGLSTEVLLRDNAARILGLTMLLLVTGGERKVNHRGPPAVSQVRGPLEVRMPPIVHEDAAAVSRLAELGLTGPDLVAVLRGADTEARKWTALAPPLMPGIVRWGKTNELLRARLAQRGWSHDGPKGLPRTISPGRDFAIVATTGDSATGLPEASPATKYAKGVQTVLAIGRNVQLAFDFSGADAADGLWAADPGEDALATWLLLYHVSPGQIRAELSLAHGIDLRGHVSAWIERIILPVIDLGGPGVNGTDVNGTDVNGTDVNGPGSNRTGLNGTVG